MRKNIEGNGLLLFYGFIPVFDFRHSRTQRKLHDTKFPGYASWNLAQMKREC